MQYSERVVRVFVSSTFRDMHEERDYLVKFIFPQLRKLCESRLVAWGEVDLRWGVTDEQKAEGKVLPICLEEIKRCQPYFIGLLGQRYGWIPDTIAQEVINREPWLKEHIHDRKSVTELEILHGVLNNPDMANRACFYFRDPAYLNKVPVETRDDFIEKDSQKKQKLIELKNKIRLSGLAFHENYPDPKKLGQLVLEDLTIAINQEFPIEDIPEPLDREAAEHEAFTRSRTGVYIGRKEYFEKLDKHAAGDGLPLVILGESGCGKSALLANWALKYRQSHPDELLIIHFIGASAYSADWAGMVRRIMGELKRRFDISGDIPNKPDELCQAFANWLHMAAAIGKVVMILDALNQLEDRNQAPDLVWLPPVIPSNIRLIVSTLAGRPLDELQKRNWPVLEVNLLNTDERKELIVEYLNQYRKSLHTQQIDRVATSQQTANPLYLRALLEELRLFGQHEDLDKRIDHYLSAKTIPELYEKILERYEHDYERDCPSLVKDAMSLIWASRRGLSETELLEMLGKDGQPLQRAIWSPLYLAADQSLISRSGLISFFHDYLREAVQHKYLPAEEDQIESHLRLADYFESREIGSRKVDELPWHLALISQWEKLVKLLSDVPFFEAIWNHRETDVLHYWFLIETSSTFNMVDSYKHILNSLTVELPVNYVISELFLKAGYWQTAKELLTQLVSQCKSENSKEKLKSCINNLAIASSNLGQLEDSFKWLSELETLCRDQDDDFGLQACLGNQGLIFKKLMNFHKAATKFSEQINICHRVGIPDGYINGLNNYGNILRKFSEMHQAIKLFEQAALIAHSHGFLIEEGKSIGNQANAWYALGELEKADVKFMEAAKLQEQAGDWNSLLKTRLNRSNLLLRRRNFKVAEEELNQLEKLLKQKENDELLAGLNINKARLWIFQDKSKSEAMLFAQQAFDLANRNEITEIKQKALQLLSQVKKL